MVFDSCGEGFVFFLIAKKAWEKIEYKDDWGNYFSYGKSLTSEKLCSFPMNIFFLKYC